jgi:hypothetical protein
MMKSQYGFLLIGVVAMVVVAAVAFTGGNAAGPEQTLALAVRAARKQDNARRPLVP